MSTKTLRFALLLVVAIGCGKKGDEHAQAKAAEPLAEQPAPDQPKATDADRPAPAAAKGDPAEELPGLRAEPMKGPFASLAAACKELANDASECANLPDPVALTAPFEQAWAHESYVALSAGGRIYAKYSGPIDVSEADLRSGVEWSNSVAEGLPAGMVAFEYCETSMDSGGCLTGSTIVCGVGRSGAPTCADLGEEVGAEALRSLAAEQPVVELTKERKGRHRILFP